MLVKWDISPQWDANGNMIEINTFAPPRRIMKLERKGSLEVLLQGCHG